MVKGLRNQLIEQPAPVTRNSTSDDASDCSTVCSGNGHSGEFIGFRNLHAVKTMQQCKISDRSLLPTL